MINELRCWCRHCRAELPPDHKGPCPKCGKLGKDCKVTVSVALRLAVSASAQKVHKYTKKHPRFIAISIALTITSLTLGYLLGALVGLLIGIIVATLNWWLTPHAIETITEITSWGDKGRRTQEVKIENNVQQQKDYSHQEIYRKFEGIENKIDSSSRIQKFGIIYALGAASIILGLSYWPGFLEHIGIDTTRFYFINPVALLALGSATIIYARVSQRAK